MGKWSKNYISQLQDHYWKLFPCSDNCESINSGSRFSTLQYTLPCQETMYFSKAFHFHRCLSTEIMVREIHWEWFPCLCSYVWSWADSSPQNPCVFKPTCIHMQVAAMQVHMHGEGMHEPYLPTVWALSWHIGLCGRCLSWISQSRRWCGLLYTTALPCGAESAWKPCPNLCNFVDYPHRWPAHTVGTIAATAPIFHRPLLYVMVLCFSPYWAEHALNLVAVPLA